MWPPTGRATSPTAPATVALLVEAGAEVNARFGGGSHDETPLHWAASSDDVEVLDALLDLGADIEAPGAVIAGGTPLDRRAGLRAVAGRPPAGRARGQDDHRRRGRPRPPGPAGGLLRRDRSGPRRGQPRLLGRLPRRPAPLRRVPAGTGRRPQLDPALGAADPAGRGRPQRRRRAGRLAAHAGSQVGRRVAAAGLGRRRGGAGWSQKLPVQEPSMAAAQLMPANRANSSVAVMVANPAVQRSSSPTRSSMSPPFRVGRRSGAGWRSPCRRGGRTWW